MLNIHTILSPQFHSNLVTANTHILDWEYPGAEDRGGSDTDGENYTQLLKELRAAIDASGHDYVVTFTAPTSYWYLRHFDLKAMEEHVNWINLMAYDLHGIWDSDNPIGNQVLAHTNLTEIDLALDLVSTINSAIPSVRELTADSSLSFGVSELSRPVSSWVSDFTDDRSSSNPPHAGSLGVLSAAQVPRGSAAILQGFFHTKVPRSPFTCQVYCSQFCVRRSHGHPRQHRCDSVFGQRSCCQISCLWQRQLDLVGLVSIT